MIGKRYIGDKAFYKRVFAIALPIIIQNGITNFVSLLDNLMVGQIGTVQMSGVSIANQLIFVFNLSIFGASSGAGIFTAQFHGSGDHKGIRHTFRFKILVCCLLSVLGIGLFLGTGDNLLTLFLQGEGDPADAAATLALGFSYLKIMLIGLLPFAISNAYASTLRECGQTLVPMIAGVCAVFVNLGLNYVLIFGHFGAPAMGVEGAAIATVISRFVELGILAVWTHAHGEKHPFVRGVYRSFRIPGKLLGQIVRKGLPLLANEFLWSSGITVLNQCYSTCGLDVVPAMSIASTINMLASVVYMALGNSVGILMGQLLGSGASTDHVRSFNRKLVASGVFAGAAFGVLLFGISFFFPQLYNTTESVRDLATRMIWIIAVLMPAHAYTLCAYFTLRSGGQAVITFLFDSCFVWALCVPLAFCLSRFTGIGILPLYALTQGMDLVKCVLGVWMIKKGTWIRNLTQ